MTPDASKARANRLLGYCALAHAASAWALTFLAFSSDSNCQLRLWVSIVTLWFVWPVVLAIHQGRSLMRVGLFVSLGGILLWPSLQSYNHLAPEAFGLPFAMNPISAWKYSSAYLAGRTQAKRDSASGILAIEDAGLKPGYERWDSRILRERFQIQIRTIEGSTFDEKEFFGHQAGYNSVSFPEIDRRFGWDRVDAARGEAFCEQSDRDEQAVRELTQRLSSIPPDSKVTTRLIRPYLDNHPLTEPSDEQRLAPVVHAVEQSVLGAVPEDMSSFELHISAKLEPGSRPSFEMSGSLNPPPSVWQAILNKLDTMPSPEWTEGSLWVRFDFLIRPPR